MALELSVIGAFTALAAGAVSFLSPCVLPLVPAYVSHVVGQGIVRSAGDTASPAAGRTKAVLLSVCFVLGFTTVFVALGAGISALSSVLGAYRTQIEIISGALIIIFGMFLTGLWRASWLERDTRRHLDQVGTGPMAAYLLGMAFAFGWSPCIGPILGAILGIAASSSRSSSGIALLTIYSFGLGLPFILTALFFDRVSTQLSKFRRTGRVLQTVAGAVMMAMGFAMITGYLTYINIWFFETFPALGAIG